MSGALGDRNHLALAMQQQPRRQDQPQQVECAKAIPLVSRDPEAQAQAPLRSAIDCIAEGMWKFAAGQCCQES
jgi:hypothetical protein